MMPGIGFHLKQDLGFRKTPPREAMSIKSPSPLRRFISAPFVSRKDLRRLSKRLLISHSLLFYLVLVALTPSLQSLRLELLIGGWRLDLLTSFFFLRNVLVLLAVYAIILALMGSHKLSKLMIVFLVGFSILEEGGTNFAILGTRIVEKQAPDFAGNPLEDYYEEGRGLFPNPAHPWKVTKHDATCSFVEDSDCVARLNVSVPVVASRSCFRARNNSDCCYVALQALTSQLPELFFRRILLYVVKTVVLFEAYESHSDKSFIQSCLKMLKFRWQSKASARIYV